ncbi:MAG: hypothetical protein RJA98_3229 [Pseudomonadota bacterium]
MALIQRISMPPPWAAVPDRPAPEAHSDAAHALWAHCADEVRGWAQAQGLATRDIVVLLPFAQLLPLARRAWARSGAWMPRIETSQTLAQSCPPDVSAADGEGGLSFDVALDTLSGLQWLNTQPWARAWARDDVQGFEQAVGAVVQSAHALARAAAAVPPALRAAHWEGARALLAQTSGPGAREALLLRVALEWAALTPCATDPVFQLSPGAWVMVCAGAPDALAAALLAAAPEGTPCLQLDLNPDPAQPFAGLNETAAADWREAVCLGFEDEAQRAAAAVLQHLNAGRAPVALVAQDRVLVRRVRVLLARQDLPVQDETGWKLSTTHAGAMVMGLLRAAQPQATPDDWLDWLAACRPAWSDAGKGLDGLDATLRRQAWRHTASVKTDALPPAAAALWDAACAVIAPLQQAAAVPLSQRLTLLATALNACGLWERLQADEAGRQLLDVLRLRAPQAAMSGAAGSLPLSADRFERWVDHTLDQAAFVPAAPAQAAVVITPLARAMLRPFGAVVLPGADDKRLGSPSAPLGLLSEALTHELGLPDAAQRRDGDTLAFAQLLRARHLTVLRRLDDGGEPLSASPLLQRLALALGRALPAADDARTHTDWPLKPTPHPLPSAADRLPDRLSASACEALRDCPYRFFALRLLRLQTADELGAEVDKRDYGTWLHAVLHRFHEQRAPELDAGTAPCAADTATEAHLLRLAEELRAEFGLDDAEFLPFMVSFVRLVPRYQQWLHDHEAEGGRWVGGERDFEIRPEAWAGTGMHGVIDRIDSVQGDDGPAILLIDYKTGSAAALKDKVKSPQEDTQLAFYAALMAGQSEAVGDIEASYLALDESKDIVAVPHPDVETSAVQLVAGLGRDLARIRAGEALPALGEGRACDYCDARGLCRRDHWVAELAPEDDALFGDDDDPPADDLRPGDAA